MAKVKYTKVMKCDDLEIGKSAIIEVGDKEIALFNKYDLLYRNVTIFYTKIPTVHILFLHVLNQVVKCIIHRIQGHKKR